MPNFNGCLMPDVVFLEHILLLIVLYDFVTVNLIPYIFFALI